MLLAIDTSTGTAGIALVEEGRVLAELTWCCGENHTVELLPRLSRLLDESHRELKTVSCVIVATGPGSYNGLRAGVSAAKGLSFSLGVPLIGITTLEAEAYQHAEAGLPVCAVANAGRGEIAAAIYQKKRGKWCQLSIEQITTVSALCSGITLKTIFCGEYVPAVAPQIKELLKQKAVLPSPAGLLRRAGYLAELGQQRIDSGSYDNVATLHPLYLRRPQITPPKKSFEIGR